MWLDRILPNKVFVLELSWVATPLSSLHLKASITTSVSVLPPLTALFHNNHRHRRLPLLRRATCRLNSAVAILFIPTTRPSDVRLVMILLAKPRLHPMWAALSGRRRGSAPSWSPVSPPSALHVNNSISPAVRSSGQNNTEKDVLLCQTWEAEQQEKA